MIYLDILLAVNLFVTYFLLLATSLLLHRKPRRLRMTLAAVFGSFSSLVIFFPELPWLIASLFKLSVGTVLVLIAFGSAGKRLFLKTALLFAAVNFLFAGVMMALWTFVTPVEMYFKNGIVYFNISALTLAFSTIVAYFIVRLIAKILDRRVTKEQLCRIRIAFEGKEVLLDAFCDTGNRLTDPFDGTPVILCEYNAVRPLLPQALQGYFFDGTAPPSESRWNRKLRIVPCQTVNGNGMIPCFFPDRFGVLSGSDERSYKVLIGVSCGAFSAGEYAALFNATLPQNL